MGNDQSEIRGHSHRNEKQPEQQTLERLDVGFQLVAVFRVGEQHPGKKGAQRHRQSHRSHEQRGANHHQQCGRSKDLADAADRDRVENRPQQVTSADDYRDDYADCSQRGQPCAAAAEIHVAGAEQGNQRQQGNDRKILEQKDGERRASVPRGKLALLGEDLEYECGGRHRQAQPDYHRALDRHSERERDRSQRSTGNQNLGGPQPEYRAAQHPQPRRLQLQADDEQQQRHTQLCEVQDILDLGDEFQAPGTDDDAGREVAQYRTQPEPAEQRHRDHCGGEKDGGFGE